jgi:hypothetical protein
MYERTAELDALLVEFARECLDASRARDAGSSFTHGAGGPPPLRSAAR